MTKKTYTVKGMHCTSCATVIECDLEDIGVTAACSYASGRVDVEYDEHTIKEKTIKEVVKKAGYDLTQ